MKKTKIEWCDATWNPVTGCRHGCKYCYARKIANRFGKFEPSNFAQMSDVNNYSCTFKLYEKDKISSYPFLFAPTYHMYRLDDTDKLVNKNIFVCSMADLFGDWVSIEWINDVLKKCVENERNNYLFLTKNPKRYMEVIERFKEDLGNMWFGTTITGSEDLQEFKEITLAMRELKNTYKNIKLFVSVEPMLNNISVINRIAIVDIFDWIIIGAESGNRKEKVVPECKWIIDLCEACEVRSKPVFMKDSVMKLFQESEKRYIRNTFPLELKKGENPC